jgi:hypothetical protein
MRDHDSAYSLPFETDFQVLVESTTRGNGLCSRDLQHSILVRQLNIGCALVFSTITASDLLWGPG